MRNATVCLLVLALAVGLRGSGERVGVDRGFEEELLIVSRHGWDTDFARHQVPLIQFQPGGPGRDGIPAIDRPARPRYAPPAGGWTTTSP